MPYFINHHMCLLLNNPKMLHPLVFVFIAASLLNLVQGQTFNWTANAVVPNLSDYFFNRPVSFEPHPDLGGIQCYQRKCRVEAAEIGSCPGWYTKRVRGNFCIAKHEYGYLVFDGVFSVFELTGACYDRVKACHSSYCNTNEFYQDREGWCRCEDRQCVLKMLLQPKNLTRKTAVGSHAFQGNAHQQENIDVCSESCRARV